MLMVVVSRSVHVAVCDFVRRSSAHFHHFNREVEMYAGKGVVAIDSHFFEPDVGDGHHISAPSVELHAFFNFLVTEG